nr:MAG TPA: C2H2 type zinc-finger protein [Caudoviricetes sp.]
MPKDTKNEKIIESMNATPIIDTNVNINIPRSAIAFDETKHKYKCSCCGKGFTKQQGNFQKTNDVLYQANGGYLPWCKECTDRYVEQITALFSNNEEHAMKDFCQRAGWNYDITALVASRETYSSHHDRSRISHYAAKRNLNCGGRKTYIDSLKFGQEQKEQEVILSKEQIKSDDVNVSGSAVDRWGVGFTPQDYKNLDEHYRMLKRNNPNADNNQEIFIKDLCNINMLKIHALQNGDSKEYATLVEQYSKTFKQAGLKTIEEKDNSNNETVGVTLATISQFIPEEFYKDKALYEDWDEIGDYFERHVCRPMENIMTGSDTRDKEFFVPENGGDDDE